MGILICNILCVPINYGLFLSEELATEIIWALLVISDFGNSVKSNQQSGSPHKPSFGYGFESFWIVITVSLGLFSRSTSSSAGGYNSGVNLRLSEDEVADTNTAGDAAEDTNDNSGKDTPTNTGSSSC